ncbi:MAG: nucleotide disphospho-sugar-binding domain-containing protein [Chitinispirillaceae bacterium]|jgi:UDP:flavonoid glycosyltransferase YjiC (YdhE family)
MAKKILLFAPAAFNLAETSRMIEIAKGVRNHSRARDVFDIRFISEGGRFETLIHDNGFPLKTVEPRITEEKIAHLAAVNDEEKLASVYTKQEMIQKVNADISCLKEIKPTAVITGSYLSMPVSCRVLNIPIVWTVQSTWFKEFFAAGAGLTDRLKPKIVKKAVDFLIFTSIRFWMWYGFIHAVNQAARHFGLKAYKPVFSYFEGEITLVAEPPEFSNAKLPVNYHFIGPLITKENFSIPDIVTNIPHDKPLVFFAMGSSGLPRIVLEIIESFEGKPYRVIAPVKFLIENLQNIRIPSNVVVTDWLPALEINKICDIAVIHGGIGTVMTAAYAGKPIVGIGMQPEQVANLACLVRKGFAIRVSKSKHVGVKVQKAIESLLSDENAKRNAKVFAEKVGNRDGPKMAADLLYNEYGMDIT